MFDNARTSHLSDEAVAAYADGVLSGAPRERARRHVAGCAECNYAVAVQREAMWALRASAAPSLPSGLFDRLREVPLTTPVSHVPESVDADGTVRFAGFGVAALVPPAPASRHRRRTVAIGAASAVVVSAVAGMAVATATEHHSSAPPVAPPAYVRGHSAAAHPDTVTSARH